MLKIRLQRVGRTHEPAYRLVLTDSKNSTKSGRYLESLGSYDARRGEKSEFKADKIKAWIGKGAQLSGTVHNLLISKKIIEGKKINVLPLKKAIVKDVPVEATPAPASAPVVESAPVEAPAEAPAEVTPESTPEATA
jgi:small subunit ribosomal protein S16